MVLTALATVSCAETPTPYDDSRDDGGDITRCQTVGGTCTSDPSVLCDVNMQPLTADDPLNTDCLGHCCVEDEPNTCNTQLQWTCIPDECSGNWREVAGTGLCGPDRVCCYWQD